MKKQLLLFIAILTMGKAVSAQDTIVKQNDELIIGTIYRLSPDYIFYTPIGETYPTSKSIFRKKVKSVKSYNFNYQSLINVDSALMHKPIDLKQSGIGSAMYIGDRRLTNRELNGLLSNYPQTYQRYSNGRTMKVFGAILGVSGGIFVGAGFLVVSSSDQVNMPILALGAVGLISGLALSNSGNIKTRKAINSYNALLEEEQKLVLSFGIRNNGVGFVLKF